MRFHIARWAKVTACITRPGPLTHCAVLVTMTNRNAEMGHIWPKLAPSITYLFKINITIFRQWKSVRSNLHPSRYSQSTILSIFFNVSFVNLLMSLASRIFGALCRMKSVWYSHYPFLQMSWILIWSIPCKLIV